MENVVFIIRYLQMHNWSLQAFSQDSNLVSYTTYVVCINFIHELRDLELKVDAERQIFEKLLIAIFIYSQSFCQKSAEGKEESYF